jgi:Holliday junction resolvase RusA-like endonuclease
MTDSITFFVPGEPVEKGSTKAFYIKKLQRVVTTANNPKTATWEGIVSFVADQAGAGDFLEPDDHIGYKVTAMFYKTRPKSLPRKYTMALTRPDLDKYMRAALDGITKTLFSDDSHVIEIRCLKLFADDNYLAEHHGQPGMLITIEKVRDGQEAERIKAPKGATKQKEE